MYCYLLKACDYCFRGILTVLNLASLEGFNNRQGNLENKGFQKVPDSASAELKPYCSF